MTARPQDASGGPSPVTLGEEVADALAEGRPVVALESTVIAHGLPSPENLRTARAMGAAIRDHGAVPATVAVLGGRLRVGLTPTELERLADADGIAKLSRADLALCMAAGGDGATTVAATMIAARLAGIDVFATGGIGGVHRGAAQSFDISADLAELAQSPVTVVASGAKAILDLPKTLEVLETLGVPVIAVGQGELPAFWSRLSGLPAPARLDDPAAIAAAARLRRRLGLPGGQLVANPVPAGDEIPLRRLAPWLDAALTEAGEAGIAAKEVTPFLLTRMAELSGGATLRANVALLRENARFAARIAREFSVAES